MKSKAQTKTICLRGKNCRVNSLANEKEIFCLQVVLTFGSALAGLTFELGLAIGSALRRRSCRIGISYQLPPDRPSPTGLSLQRRTPA